ncbi:MAG: glycosyltransferase family 4 protein [Chloroflexi bacterium]|nr:glycosyltransferase family 4 protein [Chloroflexota bacterium]
MRIAHIFKATGLSGAEAHILTLSKALRNEGHECALIALTDPRRPPTAVFESARAGGLPFESAPLHSHFDIAVVPRILSHLKSSRAQIAHTHMIHADLYGTLAAQWAGLPVVQSRHNDDKFRRRSAARWLMRAASLPAKRVVAISDSLAAFTRDVEKVPAAKIIRIHYGLDPAEVMAKARPGALRAELGIAPNAPLIGAVGRLSEQKGIPFLIEAFVRVRDSFPSARLAIAGDGPLRAELEAQAAPLGGAVRFLGWRNDTPTVMADLDVLCVPSLWEGFGLVTLEAMALSKPIVASRVSALPEIVSDGDTGLLVPSGDPAALAEALIALLADPARARAMGERGRARLEKEFTVRRMAEQHVAVYSAVGERRL